MFNFTDFNWLPPTSVLHQIHNKGIETHLILVLGTYVHDTCVYFLEYNNRDLKVAIVNFQDTSIQLAQYFMLQSDDVLSYYEDDY
jgi:hypothetical protein